MDKYGLIGYPLGHSFSKQFFTEKFVKEGIDAVYENYEIRDAKNLLDIVEREKDLCGLNCTIPYKQAIVPLLDWVSDEAQEIGAVNVIRIRRDKGKKAILEGFNSDTIGFIESIKPLLTQEHHNALVFGTGGASHSICYSLSKLNIKWKVVSRIKRGEIMGYEDITPELLRQYEIIINCTPVGMFPHTKEAPPIPYHAIGEKHLLYDLIYNPLETEFMKQGRLRGATVKNGLEMLHKQALASWAIWNEPHNVHK